MVGEIILALEGRIMTLKTFLATTIKGILKVIRVAEEIIKGATTILIITVREEEEGVEEEPKDFRTIKEGTITSAILNSRRSATTITTGSIISSLRSILQPLTNGTSLKTIKVPHPGPNQVLTLATLQIRSAEVITTNILTTTITNTNLKRILKMQHLQTSIQISKPKKPLNFDFFRTNVDERN
jgi:hypothetical protein